MAPEDRREWRPSAARIRWTSSEGKPSMTKLIATHEVEDVAHWLASPKRAAQRKVTG